MENGFFTTLFEVIIPILFDGFFAMIIFVLISFIVKYLLVNKASNGVRNFARIFFILGIASHELAHLIICKLTGAPVREIKLLGWDKENHGTVKKYSYYGSVNIHEESPFTFLQALLGALAPVYVLFWILWPLIQILFNANLDFWGCLIILLVIISLIVGIAPSAEDIYCIGAAVSRDPTYTLYQIFLLIPSFITGTIIVCIYGWIFPHEALFLLLLGAFYYVYKYLFKGIRHLYKHFKERRQSYDTEKAEDPHKKRFKSNNSKEKDEGTAQW